MGHDDAPHITPPSALHSFARVDVLSGLLFIAIAAIGLWASRNYPVGTALRMGTGYMPRLLCWMLLGLGVWSWCRACSRPPRQCAGAREVWRAVRRRAAVTVWSFALTHRERSAWSLAILLLVVVGALATRELGRWRRSPPPWCSSC